MGCSMLLCALGLMALFLPLMPRSLSANESQQMVDTALIVAVDVSQSVDEERYKLQMEGIAQALEDPSVIQVITGGANGSILFSMIAWADQANMVIDWQQIASKEDAFKVAALVRQLPLQSGEFTCLGRMLRKVSTLYIPRLPMPAARVVIDVSGDGIDNCVDRATLQTERDTVLATGATINGLPIIVAGENDVVGSGAYRAPGNSFHQLSNQPDHETTTLDQWFRDHVIGGPGTFLLAANGYQDFGRALRQKFVIEISAREQGMAELR